MALMTLGLGAEVDIATGDELSAMGDDLTKKILGSSPALPIVFTRPASAPGVGGQITLLIGSPPTGRIWEVSSITVMGNSPFGGIVSPAGFFALYAGNSAAPSIASVLATHLPLPSTTFPSSETLYCHSSQELFLLTDLAVNAPDSVSAIVGIKEWREADILARSGRP